MADNRIHGSIAQRIDILFNLRLNQWRRWRRIACLLGAVLPIGLLGWSLLPGKQTVYQSGPVSTVHKSFADNCHACHVQTFQPLRMLSGTAEQKRYIENLACGTCHPDEDTLDHNQLAARGIASRAADCFECHQEHQGTDQLLAVADAHCVRCHGNMNALVSQSDSLNFHASITSFRAHPEFAVVDPQRKLEGTTHRAAQLIDSQTREDKSPFHFNHAAHLHADGMLLPRSHPEYTNENKRKKLQCSDCHTTDASGDYMQPLSYERHCADCHPLVFSTKLAQPRTGEFEVTQPWPLPHGSEEALHGVIRDRLIAFARQKAETDETDTPKSTRPQPPNKGQAAAAPSQSEYEFAERELNGIRWGEAVVQQSMGATGRVIREGCEFCHQVEANGDFDPIQDFPWKVSRRADGRVLPQRWMPHSRFRHDRHNSFGKHALQELLQGEEIGLALDWNAASPQAIAGAHCIACHEDTISSNTTQSVLMPSIQVCHHCHGSTKGKIGFARADCVECHVYHDRH